MPRPSVHAPRIAADLRRRILSGELPPGAPLPGRRELATSYGVALLTLQRALVPLFAEGLLHAESTRGTYVAEHARRPGPPLRVAIIAQSEVDPAEPGAAAVWAARAARGCETALSAAGVSTRYYNVMHRTRRWYASVGGALDAAADDGVAAIIGINLTEADGWLADLAAFAPRWKAPLVYACGGTAPSGITVVAHDQAASGSAAAEHCFAAGYQRLLAPRPHSAAWLDQRIAGARKTAGRRLRIIDLHGRLEPYGTALPADDLRRFWREVVEAASANDLPTAVLAPNDAAATDLLEAMEALAIEPGVVGIIGFDDQPRARSEGLSSMAPPIEEVGTAAARSCLLALRGGEPGAIALPSRLIARPSTFLTIPSKNPKFLSGNGLKSKRGIPGNS